MADKLMYISNNDTQKYPSVDYNWNVWTLILMTQLIKFKSLQICQANELINDK